MNLIYGRCKLNHTIEKGVYASLNNGSSYPKITQIFSSDSVLGSNSAYSRLKQGALSVFKEKVNIAENIARQVVKGVSKNSAINPGVRLVGAVAETLMISFDIEKVTELADMLSERLALQPV